MGGTKRPATRRNGRERPTRSLSTARGEVQSACRLCLPVGSKMSTMYACMSHTI